MKAITFFEKNIFQQTSMTCVMVTIFCLICTSHPVFAQNRLEMMDKIQIDTKYKSLEQAASANLKQELATLRATGVQKKWTFQVGVTSVAHLNIKDITGGILPDGNAVPSGGNDSNVAPPMGGSVGNANATTFDLRTLGVITPIRSQNNCGSCWAFGALASVETAHVLKNKVNPAAMDLSEQQVLNCSGAGTCKGGQMSKVLDYLKGTNAATEAAYAYTANDRACAAPALSPYKVQNWGWVGSNASMATQQEIKNALVNYAAVSTWIWVNHSYLYYVGGVLNDNTRNPDEGGGHFVQIIGWDDNLHAWLVKNSWGTSWGEGGFFRMRRGTNECGIEGEAYSIEFV